MGLSWAGSPAERGFLSNLRGGVRKGSGKSRGPDHSSLGSGGEGGQLAWKQEEGPKAFLKAPGGRGRWLERERNLERHPRLRRSWLWPQGDTEATTRPPSLDTAATRSPGQRNFPRLWGAGSPVPPLLPARPCPSRLCPSRRGAAGPNPQHSRLPQLRRLLPCPGFSSTHSRPKQRRRIRAARNLAGRNTWGLCARNRKRLCAPPTGCAGAFLGGGRFGPLCVPRLDCC